VMQNQSGTTFDPEFLQCWMQIVSKNGKRP